MNTKNTDPTMLRSYLEESSRYPVIDRRRVEYVHDCIDDVWYGVKRIHEGRNPLKVAACVNEWEGVHSLTKALARVAYGASSLKEEQRFIEEMMKAPKVEPKIRHMPIDVKDVEGMKAAVTALVHAYAASIERAGDSVAV